MKKNILITLMLGCSLLFTACGEKSETPTEVSTTPSVKVSPNEVITPLVLGDKTICPSSFIKTNENLIFSNWEDNDKISIINGTLPNNLIKSDTVSDFFNYYSNTFTIVNDIIYFADRSNANNLSSLKIIDKTYTKLNNSSAHNITSSESKIFYIDIPDKSSNTRRLYSYDINTKQTSLIIKDNVGKYTLNGNFILYQNLDDGSKLYKTKLDGTETEKISDFSVESFTAHSNELLVVNSDDNNSLYLIDPSNYDSKRLAIMNISNLKSNENQLYCINNNDSNYLYSLTVNIDTSEVSSKLLLSDYINDYFLTDNEIFVQKAININNAYVIPISSN